MKPLVFLGHEFRDDQDFRREYPAYAQYIGWVRAGADTPHKIELAIYDHNRRVRNQSRRKGGIKRRRQA